MSGNGLSQVNGERIARDVIVIVASMGGVAALKRLCSELPSDFPGLIGVVLHRSPMYDIDTQAIYEKAGRIRVCEPRHEEPLQGAPSTLPRAIAICCFIGSSSS